jgi:hypothetical protein
MFMRGSRSVFSVITIVVLLAFAAILSYMFIQPLVGDLKGSPSIQQTAISDVVHDRVNVGGENREESNMALYEQTVDTVKKNIDSIQHEAKADNHYASLKTETKPSIKSSSFQKNVEKKIYTYTPPADRDVNEREPPLNENRRDTNRTSFRDGKSYDNYKPSADYDSDVEVDEKPMEANDPEGDSVDANITVFRDIQPGENEGEYLVHLTIVDNGGLISGLIIREYIPQGWDILNNLPKSGRYNSATREIKWLLYGSQLTSQTITYNVRSGNGSSKFYGEFLYNYVNKPITMQIQGVNGA